MVTIDLKHVNESAPYALRLAPYAQLSYILTTDYGVNYTLSFMPSDLMPEIEAYEFAISNTNHRKSPRDPKLRQTILTLVYEFFRTREAVMLYLCETGDACLNRGSAHRVTRQPLHFCPPKSPMKRASPTLSHSSSVPTTHGSPSSPNNSATQSNCSGTTSRKTSAKTKKALPSFAQSK